MNREDLVQRGEAFHEALGREAYLTGAGLKTTAAFQEIYARYADLASDDALEAARASGSPALFEWVVDVHVGRAVAPFEERQLAWEQDAVLEVDGATVPYLRAPIEIANTGNRDRRIAIDEARVAKASDLESLRRDRFAVERDALAPLTLGDYVQTVSALSGIDLDALGASAATFLAETADMYEEVLAAVVKRRVGVPMDQLVRSDAAWAFRANQFDEAFPGDVLMETAERQMRDLGLDATRGGRVRFDTEDRPAKQPRAFCAPVRVPDEVYLVLRPRGGHQDYHTFWHELGHAMHFASAERSLPFEARWLGDNSVTEGFAMLWDHTTLNPLWLSRYTNLPQRERTELVFELAVNELFFVRRYAAKLCYELEFHRGDLGQMGPRYVEHLSQATRFRYLEGDALLDVDPAFYAARYLRAWQLEAVMADTLTQRYDADWFRNPAAGSAIHEWMARGQRDPADVLATELSGEPVTFGPLRRRLEACLN